MSILVKFIIWKDGGDIEVEGMCANGGMDRLGMVCMIHDRQCHPKMSFFRKQKNGKLNYLLESVASVYVTSISPFQKIVHHEGD
jgi:hypothetical protein